MNIKLHNAYFYEPIIVYGLTNEDGEISLGELTDFSNVHVEIP